MPEKPAPDQPPLDEKPLDDHTSVTPDDYPDGSGGKPNYKDRDKA